MITRYDGEKMLICIFKLNHRGEKGGNSHLILVHFVAGIFQTHPIHVYLSMYELFLNLNSLLVKRQIDKPSPGAVTGGN